MYSAEDEGRVSSPLFSIFWYQGHSASSDEERVCSCSMSFSPWDDSRVYSVEHSELKNDPDLPTPKAFSCHFEDAEQLAR